MTGFRRKSDFWRQNCITLDIDLSNTPKYQYQTLFPSAMTNEDIGRFILLDERCGHVCFPWFFWYIFLLECCFQQRWRHFVTHFMVLAYLVPPECVECLLPRGPLQPPVASCPLTTASSTVSVPWCDQVLLSIISAFVPQPGYTPSPSGQGQLLIQVHLLTKCNFIYMCRCVRIYINETDIYKSYIYRYVYVF